MRSLLGIVVITVLMGCVASHPRPYGTFLSREELAACKARGGHPDMALFTVETCYWPTIDAGKKCTTKSDCQGFCEAPWDTEAGAAVSGTCSAQGADKLGGCFNHVQDGKATGGWCLD